MIQGVNSQGAEAELAGEAEPRMDTNGRESAEGTPNRRPETGPREQGRTKIDGKSIVTRKYGPEICARSEALRAMVVNGSDFETRRWELRSTVARGRPTGQAGRLCSPGQKNVSPRPWSVGRNETVLRAFRRFRRH